MYALRKTMMSMSIFVGRTIELKQLLDLYNRKRVNLAVIKGRRRIGKSFLVNHFAQKKALQNKNQFLSFTGLPPSEGVSIQTQIDYFAHQLTTQLHIPLVTFSDWADALNFLSHHIQEGAIVFFDEISWMGGKDPTFVPKLKAWWDVSLSKKQHVLLIFCGSVSTWIDDNIINSTAFFGRISAILSVDPFSIRESALFLKEKGFKGSAFEIYKILSILGGIPWYLEQIDPHHMADDNIQRLCFQKNGGLFHEFNRLFSDIFNGRGKTYKKILEALKDGMKTLAELRDNTQFPNSGTFSSLTSHLIVCGFISKHYHWSLKTEKISKQSLYRICDPYIRFYLKTIEKNKIKIEQGAYDHVTLSQIPGFDINIGLQVEHLLLQNRKLILKSIDVDPADCSFDGPYRQTQTVRSKGCQIDYLVQTRTKNLFLCEFKFVRKELGLEIIEEVQEKTRRFSHPHGFAVVPVLFHVGGVSPSVYDKDYFYRIVDIADFLDGADQ